MFTRPKVLLVTTCRWYATTRLMLALTDAGFCVELVCPGGHPVAELSIAPRSYPYYASFPVRSIRSAIERAAPDLVIPCDDLSTALLHSIHAKASREGRKHKVLAALIERSLGDSAGYAIVRARRRLLEVAEQQGIRVPKTSALLSMRQLDEWIVENGLPAVLKTDGTSGGIGVRIVTSGAEARQAFTELKAPPLAARVAKRALIDRDTNLLVPFLLRRSPSLSIQSFVRGYDATGAVACRAGAVLASSFFEVVHTWNPKGPASVVRRVENAEMLSAATKMVAKLKLSGLYGFDFMVEEETKDALLIEMNPRATQTCHLPLGTGHDLPAALWFSFSGHPAHETDSITAKKEIALFPQEWQRNPASRYLTSAYHDIPWQEPDLIRACVQRAPNGAAWPAKGLQDAYYKLPWLR